MRDYHSNPSSGNEALGRIVANLFRDHGWDVLDQPNQSNAKPDFILSRHGHKLVAELKRASEGRRDRVIPLLSQAALEATHYARKIPGHPLPVAIVGANRIPDLIAEEAKEFIRERAPEVAIGMIDLEGFRLFAGHGLESLSSERRLESNIGPSKGRARAPDLFSDLNQWMLKVLLAPRIAEEYLSAPRGRYRGPSQLAEAAHVSVMSAFRFVEEFSKEGFLESRSGLLRPVRLRELMNRWASASQRRIAEVPMRWVLDRGKKAFLSSLRSYEGMPSGDQGDPLLSPKLRLCLGLFEAAEALGIGFVHGVKPYLYFEALHADVLNVLGLSEDGPEREADLYVRIPANRESVFRGAVQRGEVPVSDILQIWLDVGQHPSRGKEQADLIWRKILSPGFESSEP